MSIGRILMCLSAVALAGCQRSSSPTLSVADSLAIRATSERWLAAVRAGRWDDAAATYTDDATLQFPSATFVGRSAIRKSFEGMPPFGANRTLEIDEIRGRGDMAFVAGHSTDTTDPGAPVVVGRYMDIRLRQPDGTWLYYRDMVTSVPPPATTQPVAPTDKHR